MIPKRFSQNFIIFANLKGDSQTNRHWLSAEEDRSPHDVMSQSLVVLSLRLSAMTKLIFTATPSAERINCIN